MVRVKVCGITNPDDARTAAGSGADAIGLVFAESPETAAVLRGGGVKVIKALRVRGVESLEAMDEYSADLFLLDAWSEKARGGTGTRFDWRLAKSLGGRG